MPPGAHRPQLRRPTAPGQHAALVPVEDRAVDPFLHKGLKGFFAAGANAHSREESRIGGSLGVLAERHLLFFLNWAFAAAFGVARSRAGGRFCGVLGADAIALLSAHAISGRVTSP